MEGAQTSSLDEDLRIRLEGAGEVLEQGVRRLDGLARRLQVGAEKLERDDVDEVRAVLASLPVLDEAVERAERLEAARPLAQDARRAKEQVGQLARACLGQLGKSGDDAGLAETLRRLANALQYVGRPAGPMERALFEGTLDRPWMAFGFLVAQLALVLLALSWPLPAILFMVTGFVLWLRRTRTHWSLLPDRLQLRTSGRPLMDVQYEAISAVTTNDTEVVVHAPDLVLALPTRNPEGLARLLRSMRENMGSASARPRPSAVFPIHLGAGDRGAALFTPEGVYVVREAEERSLVAQVLPGAEGAKAEDALDLLRHLPPEVLAQRLRGLPGTWWPADEVRAVDAANRLVSRTFQRAEEVLRVVPSTIEGRGSLVELDALTAAWPRG
ncbi:MAG: hypothetical protein AB1938_32570 [Myxococcota bacterium]